MPAHSCRLKQLTVIASNTIRHNSYSSKPSSQMFCWICAFFSPPTQLPQTATFVWKHYVEKKRTSKALRRRSKGCFWVRFKVFKTRNCPHRHAAVDALNVALSCRQNTDLLPAFGAANASVRGMNNFVICGRILLPLQEHNTWRLRMESIGSLRPPDNNRCLMPIRRSTPRGNVAVHSLAPTENIKLLICYASMLLATTGFWALLKEADQRENQFCGFAFDNIDHYLNISQRNCSWNDT